MKWEHDNMPICPPRNVDLPARRRRRPGRNDWDPVSEEKEKSPNFQTVRGARGAANDE